MQWAPGRCRPPCCPGSHCYDNCRAVQPQGPAPSPGPFPGSHLHDNCVDMATAGMSALDLLGGQRAVLCNLRPSYPGRAGPGAGTGRVKGGAGSGCICPHRPQGTKSAPGNEVIGGLKGPHKVPVRLGRIGSPDHLNSALLPFRGEDAPLFEMRVTVS